MRTLLACTILIAYLLLAGIYLPIGAAHPSDGTANGGAVLPPTPPEAAVFDGHAAPDTLHFSVTAGEALIAPLPDEVQGTPVSRYSPLRVPTLSWTVDRSFYWNTRERDSGRYELLFLAERSDAPGDTLALVVAVE